MSLIEITSMSTKGQVVIPASMRRKLHITGGAKLLVVQEGENILLKPIAQPETSEFNEIIKLADQIREEIDLTEDDIEKAIQSSRAAHESRR
ncbi:MAG: AbrB/MazE/SpoVT family DNA-binding domain-containing protein [Candidatus Marinimicrobia bacterium]|nr:AbrB/MazE/SpoVT family DNA-binding domain-containing protein [Candidatus Neomarinimicrobiota bacterium]